MLPPRFNVIDQTRGLAISLMIVAHFGPALWNRIGLQGPLLDLISLFGRFATPAFIAIFGFTIAFAYLDRAVKDPIGISKKLILRSGVILFAALSVAFPGYLNTLIADEHWGESITLNLLLNTYGVLLFYALAVFSTGLLIFPLARKPYIFPIVLGAILVYVGSYLGYDAWSPHGETAAELLRLMLVSGKYGFLVNYGVALILVSFGWHLRQLLRSGREVGALLLVAGVVLLLLSLSMGRIVGWRDLADLKSGYVAPPQIWYLLAICGVMMVTMYILNRSRIPYLSFFLEHTGRNPLSIYIAHAFVLPAISLMRTLVPQLPDLVCMIVPTFSFLCYWILLIRRSSDRSRMARIPHA